jgi:putative transposase
VKAITEELSGHGFSAFGIRVLDKGLDEALTAFAERRLEEPSPSLILEARYEKVREEGVIRSRAVLIAIGIHEGGRREVRGVDLAPRESQSSWKDFLVRLKDRGLHGVEFVVSGDHAGPNKPSPRC